MAENYDDSWFHILWSTIFLGSGSLNGKSGLRRQFDWGILRSATDKGMTAMEISFFTFL